MKKLTLGLLGAIAAGLLAGGAWAHKLSLLPEG